MHAWLPDRWYNIAPSTIRDHLTQNVLFLAGFDVGIDMINRSYQCSFGYGASLAAVSNKSRAPRDSRGALLVRKTWHHCYRGDHSFLDNASEVCVKIRVVWQLPLIA